jgi:succinate dehydrogenase flavin-adding protein (antitoxin of CptAB toxin-antitoxin module)
MGGISPIVLSWIARDQKRAQIKALKEAARRSWDALARRGVREADPLRVPFFADSRALCELR